MMIVDDNESARTKRASRVAPTNFEKFSKLAIMLEDMKENVREYLSLSSGRQWCPDGE
jgi:hypothetical protein